MMQWWTSDAVRFMRDASEYGDHYARLSNYLMRWLPADEMCIRDRLKRDPQFRPHRNEGPFDEN